MTSWPLDSKPSRRVRSCATILFSCSSTLLPLLGHRASSSSINKTHGPYCEAFLKKRKHSRNLKYIWSFSSMKSEYSLRKQPTFNDVTTGFPLRYCQRNNWKNSILMMRHIKVLLLTEWSKFLTSQRHYPCLDSVLSLQSRRILQCEWWY